MKKIMSALDIAVIALVIGLYALHQWARWTSIDWKVPKLGSRVLYEYKGVQREAIYQGMTEYGHSFGEEMPDTSVAGLRWRYT
jgi:hypothetical protein